MRTILADLKKNVKFKTSVECPIAVFDISYQISQILTIFKQNTNTTFPRYINEKSGSKRVDITMSEELYSPQRIGAITTIVSKATGVENSVLKASMKKAPKLSALYYTLSHGHIFASFDGSFLYASNSVDFSTHVTKFQQGGRTPVSKDFTKFVEMTLSALNRPKSHFPTLSESDLLEDAETGENTGKSQSEGKSDGESEYRIDPRTGKRYKVLKGMDLSGMTAKDRKTALKMGMTITQLRETVDQDPEFQNMDNTSLTSLDESASIFLPHLRG